MTTQEYRTGTVEIAPNTYAFIQPGGMTNAGFIVGQDGVLVIDALMTLTLARTLLGEVRKVTSKPMRALINTHYHGDHTFGNYLFRPAPIVGHAATRDYLVNNWNETVQSFKLSHPKFAPGIDEVELAPPDITFADSMTLHLDDRRIDLHWYGWAHTPSDIFVQLPREGVVFGGDALPVKWSPSARSGHPTSWIQVLNKAEALDFETVVPGHGPVGRRRALTDLRSLLVEVRDYTVDCYKAGMPVQEAVAGLDPVRRFTEVSGAARLTSIVERVYQELSGELR